MIGPILKGKKVILKPIAVKEAANYFVWFRDLTVTKYLGNDNISLTLVEEKKFIANSRKSKNKIIWSIYTKDGQHIGSTGFNSYDKNNKKATWGIVIGDKNYWHLGYGSDVLKTILAYAFGRAGLNRVELGAFKANKWGLRAYIKCGFKQEGIARQAFYKRGKFYDDIIMAILKQDYKK